jgi:hypothetical protein
MIEASFSRSSKVSFRVSSSQRQSQESRASSSIESETSSSILLKRIRRNDVNNEVINLYIAQMFDMYQNNRIKNHELYDTILHDFFDLILNHWNMFTSIIWNFVNTICYTQDHWISHSSRKKIRTELMYRFIKESFRRNWTSNQIAYVKKNYRKLSSIIRDRKNELKENASQWERLRVASIELASIEFSITSVLAFTSTSAFTFIFASIFTSVSASISTSVSVAFSLSAESSNVQSTQQSNVQRISKYLSAVYENRQYSQESNSQLINQHWSISQRNLIRYDDHQSFWYSKQSFNESSTHRQTYN